MPEKLDRCVEEVMKQGKTESQAYAICNASIDNKINFNYSLDATKFKYEICPDSGFMRAIGVCARDGIQEYYGYELGLSGDDANKVFNVYRPKDEVVASLSSYNGAVVTDEHPEKGLVFTDDSDTLTKGNTSEAYGIEKDGVYYVIAKTTVTNPELIKKIQEGKRELSAGYTRDLVEESGDFNGTPYQFVQRNIKANHVAVVQEGRCGNACKINLDKKGKLMETGLKIQIDGKSVTMDSNEAARYISELKTQRDEAMAEMEETKKSTDATVEELQATIAMKMEELKKLQDQIAGMLTPEEAEEIATETVEIENDAEELGMELKEKSNDAKMKEILGAITSNKVSVDSLDKTALRTVYKISVDQAKASKKAQADGYNGKQVDNKTVPRTGNLSNDLNAIAQKARAERKDK